MMSFLSPAGSIAMKVQVLRMPMPLWLTTEFRLPDRLVEGEVDFGCDQHHVGRGRWRDFLCLVDQFLRFSGSISARWASTTASYVGIDVSR